MASTARHIKTRALTLCLYAALGNIAQAATVTVNSADDAVGSPLCNLRNAMGLLSGGFNSGDCQVSGVFAQNDTVVFDDTLVHSTVTLTQGQLGLGNAHIAIVGSGQTIDADRHSRVFSVIQGRLDLSQITLTGGHTHGYGGAVYLHSGATLQLVESTITDNYAPKGGAIFADTASSVTLDNSTISGNYAQSKGGAIYVSHSGAVITNSTISGNTSAGKTGGMYTDHGNVTLANSILSANLAVTTGGADFLSTNPGAAVIFYSIIGDAPIGSYLESHTIVTLSPGLGPLQDNGGPTQTMALNAGSPAIDAGSNAYVGVTSTDQRGSGFSRIINTTVDIGAVEFHDEIFSDGFDSF